jgi:prevent-host-death family protein
MLNSNQKGSIAETAIALEALRCGVEVYRPFSEHARCDLIFGIGATLYRVQCKSVRRNGEVLCVRLVGNRHAPRGYVRTKYSAEEVDLIAAHCHELNATYLFSFDLVATGRSGFQMRLSPPKNGQRASIHFAENHLLSGAVAQLEERRYGIPEAVGSSPTSSIPPDPASPLAVGAHEFRNLFGHFMERAAAGEEIRVTRRGKPTVRLLPAETTS